jgi:uncharacterized protein (DUF1499 family)
MLVKLLMGVLLLAGLALALRLYMSRLEQDRLRPDEVVDIRGLREPLPGNSFLACPPDFCAATAAPSPVFAMSADRLSQQWRALMARTTRVTIVADAPEQHRLVVIEHTKLLRFPDIITVEFVALADDRSSLAIYSRSRYGKGDFGANRQRVLAWLGAIEEAVTRQ